MLSTEIEHLLGFADPANPGTAQLTALHQQTENLNRGRFGRGSHERHSAVALGRVEVNIQVVVGGNCVQNEVKAVDVFCISASFFEMTISSAPIRFASADLLGEVVNNTVCAPKACANFRPM
jgi:hypothetical protein